MTSPDDRTPPTPWITPHGLSPGGRALVRLSAALALAGEARLDEALEECRRRADPREVEEVILQSYLFLGYPAALNAFARWREVSGRAAPEAVDEVWEGWARRGEDVCRRVYGGQYGRLRENVRALHPDMERWMVVEGYGKVLGRPGLALEARELCIAALLAALGAPTQLHSHLRGALNVGAPPDVVEEAVELACGELARWPGPGDLSARCREARKVWGRVRGG